MRSIYFCMSTIASLRWQCDCLHCGYWKISSLQRDTRRVRLLSTVCLLCVTNYYHFFFRCVLLAKTIRPITILPNDNTRIAPICAQPNLYLNKKTNDNNLARKTVFIFYYILCAIRINLLSPNAHEKKNVRKCR